MLRIVCISNIGKTCGFDHIFNISYNMFSSKGLKLYQTPKRIDYYLEILTNADFVIL